MATPAAQRRGLLIVLEGLDRAGKTGAHAHLVEALNAARPDSAVGLRFPDYATDIGKIILRYLKRETELDDHAVHLLFAANRQETKARMHALLAAGTTIVLDRYVYSGAAYSIAKGLDATWCCAVDQRSGLPGPDLVLYLDVSPQVAAARADFGADRYENVEMQAKARAAFARFRSLDVWETVDADETKEAVFQAVLAAATRVLDRHALLKEDVPVRTWLGLCFAEAENDPRSDQGAELML